MAFNIANALQQNYPDAIGIDQLKQRNALAQRDQALQEQQASNQNALAQAQLGQITRQNSLQDEALAAQKRNESHQAAYAWAQNLASIKDPSQFQQVAAQAAADPRVQALGIDISHITPDNVQAFLAQARGAAGQVPFEQTPEALKIQAEGKARAGEAATQHQYRLGEIGAQGYQARLTDAQKPQTSNIPSGYEPDPAKPGALRPIAGGPHDPNATAAGMDSRSSVMFNRVAASAQAAAKAIQNIAELPITTSTGWFGTAEPGKGIYDSAKNVLSQKVTGQEAQDFKTMIAGVSRNLSTIETAGLAPNGAITSSMNNVLLGEGDTQMTKLRKMAEMRQIVEENLKPQLANPKLAPAQKDLVRSIISSVQQSVPFTHHDITLLQRSKNPQATIMDFAVKSGLPAQPAQNSAPVRVNSPQEAMSLAPGTIFITPDGRQKVR